MGVVKGQKCVSPLFTLHGFNLVDGFVVDPMHCVDLGIVSTITNWWLEQIDQEYYIGDRLEEIDRIIESIRVPREIQRNFKPLCKRKEWKASQWRSWLYVLPVVLKGILSEVFLSHFSQLSRAIYLLSGCKIAWDDISKAEDLVRLFVRNGYDLYGEVFYFYNLHQLIHMPSCVTRWGPLWGLSNYRFESFNGDLLKFVKGSNAVEMQIADRFVRKMLLRNCKSFLESERHEFEIINPKTALLDSVTLEILIRQFQADIISESSQGVIGFHTFKAKERGCLEEKFPKKCDDVVSLHSKELGYVRKFYKLACKCKLNCQCENLVVDLDCFRVKRTRGYKNFKRHVEFERKIVPIRSVKSSKFFVVKTTSLTYFVQLPNLFECS